MVKLLLYLCGSYLLSSIPFGLLVGKLWGIDVRKFGSGNIGATNVLRTVGILPGIIVLIADTLKGFIPVFFVKSYFTDLPQGLPEIMVSIIVILGHTYTIFLKFKGGKGVATSLGVFLALDYRLALSGLLIFIIIVYITRYISLGSMIGMISTPVMVFYLYRSSPKFYTYFIFTIIAAFSVIYSHRSNIKNLISGKERKFGKKSNISTEPGGNNSEEVHT